ncbi:growth hormone secretagogue receptor type 1-like [Saccoglossus kowalevskii]
MDNVTTVDAIPFYLNFSTNNFEYAGSWFENATDRQIVYFDNGTGNQPVGSTPNVVFETSFLITVAIVGFIGNVLVCAVYFQKKYRHANASLYIQHLALGDLLAVLVVVLFITELFPNTWRILWLSDYQCIIHRSLRFVSFNITTFIILAIAIDRYYAICHPLWYKVSVTRFKTGVVIVCAWIVAIVPAVPIGLTFKTRYNDENTGAVAYAGKSPYACRGDVIAVFGEWFNTFKAIYTSFILFYIPALISIVCYSRIIYTVWKSWSTFQSSQKGHQLDKTHWKTARMLLVVFLAYCCSYILYYTYALDLLFFDHKLFSPILKNIGLIFPYANSCINPIIYSFMNPKFRKACFEIIRIRVQPKSNSTRLSERTIQSNNTKTGSNERLTGVSTISSELQGKYNDMHNMATEKNSFENEKVAVGTTVISTVTLKSEFVSTHEDADI